MARLFECHNHEERICSEGTVFGPQKNPRMFDERFRDSGLNIFNPVAYEFTASTLIVVPWRFILMVPNEAEVGVALDFAEDLSDDVLSKVVLHSRARDALC